MAVTGSIQCNNGTCASTIVHHVAYADNSYVTCIHENTITCAESSNTCVTDLVAAHIKRNLGQRLSHARNTSAQIGRKYIAGIAIIGIDNIKLQLKRL